MLQKIFKKDDWVRRREVAGETILVPIRGKLAEMQHIFALDPVAACIWCELDGEKTLEQVRESVVEQFGVGPEEAGRDVGEFVAELVEAGLVEEVP